MTKSELIEIITAKQKHLPAKDVELALKQILEIMSDALSQGERIEIRGFGSFSLHFRPPRQGRNPKTGEAVRCQANTSRTSSRARTCASGSTTAPTAPSETRCRNTARVKLRRLLLPRDRAAAIPARTGFHSRRHCCLGAGAPQWRCTHRPPAA